MLKILFNRLKNVFSNIFPIEIDLYMLIQLSLLSRSPCKVTMAEPMYTFFLILFFVHKDLYIFLLCTWDIIIKLHFYFFYLSMHHSGSLCQHQMFTKLAHPVTQQINHTIKKSNIHSLLMFAQNGKTKWMEDTSSNV